MRRDSRQPDNVRPTGVRVQHRRDGRKGVIVANPAGNVVSPDFFVLWDDDSSTTGVAPRFLGVENHLEQ